MAACCRPKGRNSFDINALDKLAADGTALAKHILASKIAEQERLL
jgi:hypothetical protein